MKTIRRTVAVAAMAALAATAATAQEAVDEQGVQTVETRHVRDPAMMPYAQAYEMLTKVGKVGEGRIDFVIRLLQAKTMQPIPNLEVALQGTTIFEKLPLEDDATLRVPLDPKYIADKAEFVTNRKKGTVGIHLILLPVLPQENLAYRDFAASIAAGRRAIGELMPWYMRLFFGRIHDVLLCYPEAGRQVAVGAGVRAATEEAKNPLNGKTVYCAVFPAGEVEAAPQVGVTPPPGYVALLR